MGIKSNNSAADYFNVFGASGHDAGNPPPPGGQNGNYSVFFDGTTSKSWVKAADNAAYAAGTGDFSIECWLKAQQYSHYMNFVNTREAAGTTAGWTFSVESDSKLGFYSNGHQFTTNGSISDNTWTHVVVQRTGDKMRMFQDGTMYGYNGTSQSYTNQLFCIGINCSGPGSSGAAGWYRGYISNLRYVVGSVPTTYQTSSTTIGDSVFTSPTSFLTTTSQGATSSDVKFLGMMHSMDATETVTTSSIVTEGGHTSLPTVGHDGPF